ncbi:MAG: flavodoxin family protein [Candidatus Hodarchaeota archaeon]
MKILGINGSSRPEGNTTQLLEMVIEAIKEELPDVETEIIQLASKKVEPCLARGNCFKKKDNKCIQDDDVNEIFAKMLDADAIILGSPTYFADVSGRMKNLIDRIGYLGIANGHALKHKLGAAVVAVRRQGACRAFNSINMVFLINQMFVVGSSYWNLGIGKHEGDVQEDKEGQDTMKNLGKNFAWLLKKIG